jgi:hypothetical protein
VLPPRTQPGLRCGCLKVRERSTDEPHATPFNASITAKARSEEPAPAR